MISYCQDSSAHPFFFTCHSFSLRLVWLLFWDIWRLLMALNSWWWIQALYVHDVLYIWMWIFRIWFASFTSSRHWNYAFFFCCLSLVQSVSAYFDLVTQTHAHAPNSDKMRIEPLSAAKLDEEVLYAFSTDVKPPPGSCSRNPNVFSSKRERRRRECKRNTNAEQQAKKKKLNRYYSYRCSTWHLAIMQKFTFHVILRWHWADAYWRMLTALWWEFDFVFFLSRLLRFSVRPFSLFDDTQRGTTTISFIEWTWFVVDGSRNIEESLRYVFAIVWMGF